MFKLDRSDLFYGGFLACYLFGAGLTYNVLVAMDHQGNTIMAALAWPSTMLVAADMIRDIKSKHYVEYRTAAFVK